MMTSPDRIAAALLLNLLSVHSAVSQSNVPLIALTSSGTSPSTPSSPPFLGPASGAQISIIPAVITTSVVVIVVAIFIITSSLKRSKQSKRSKIGVRRNLPQTSFETPADVRTDDVEMYDDTQWAADHNNIAEGTGHVSHTIDETQVGNKHHGLSIPADKNTSATYDDTEQPPYESLHMASCEAIVPKGGSLLPDIRVSDLGRHIESMKAKIDGFEEEFKKLPYGPTADWDTGNTPENRKKNCNLKIIAYDHSRVLLGTKASSQPLSIPKSDYINASYISGYGNARKAYIATQAPMKTTTNDMWQMVWETECNKIVMFAEKDVDGKIKYGTYWPEQGSVVYGDIKVALLDTETHDAFVKRIFGITYQGSSRLVHQFHFTSWPEGGMTPKASAILDLKKRVHLVDGRGGPLIVHCSTGIGRTGTYIAIDRCLQQAEEEGVVNVWGTVYQMRTERVNMVENMNQYQFIYDVLQKHFNGKI